MFTADLSLYDITDCSPLPAGNNLASCNVSTLDMPENLTTFCRQNNQSYLTRL